MRFLNESFARNIYRLRIQRGLSRTVLGGISGVAPHTIAGIENLRHSPTLTTVELIAKAFDIDPCELFK